MFPTACSGVPIWELTRICSKLVAKFLTYSHLAASVEKRDWRTFAYSVRHLKAESVIDLSLFYRFCISSM